MRRYSLAGLTALAIIALHFGTYALHFDGFATIAERNVYFSASSGRILVGSMDLGGLAALVDNGPTLNLSRKPTYEIEGLGNTVMKLPRPSFGSVESPVWPGIAFPPMLLLILPVAYAVTVAARSAEQDDAGKPDPVAS